MVARAARFLLGVVATCGLALAACGSRTGFLDGDGVSLPDDDATGDAGSGGSAGAGGLGLGGGSMGGSGGSNGQVPPEVAPTLPPNGVTGCGDDGRFEGDVVIFGSPDFAPLEGCTVVDGSVQVAASVANLAPLSQLREVRGILGIVRGPLSLEGLENLQEVQALQLDSIAARSLQPLAGLRRVRTLAITGEVPQGDLSGLGGIVNLREIQIEDSSLPTLAGLAVPPRMATIRIQSSATAELSTLAAVNRIDGDLFLSNVRGLATLDALSSLVSAKSFGLSENPDLIHVDGVRQLSLEQLSVHGNASLEHLPDFENNDTVRFVQILNNPALRNAPRFLNTRLIEQVQIRNNAQLERVELPALEATIRSTSSTQGDILIADNALLVEIRMPALTRTASLTIAANPALVTVDVPLLQLSRDRLVVGRNTSLVSSALGALLSAETPLRKIGGNQGDTPLASCPWTDDARCDEVLNLCAPGSDLVDCSTGFEPY